MGSHLCATKVDMIRPQHMALNGVESDVWFQVSSVVMFDALEQVRWVLREVVQRTVEFPIARSVWWMAFVGRLP